MPFAVRAYFLVHCHETSCRFLKVTSFDGTVGTLWQEWVSHLFSALN